MVSLNNGTALITGGAGRIGRAIALALAASGYALVLHVRRSDQGADALAREIVGARTLSPAISQMRLLSMRLFPQPPHSAH